MKLLRRLLPRLPWRTLAALAVFGVIAAAARHLSSPADTAARNTSRDLTSKAKMSANYGNLPLSFETIHRETGGGEAGGGEAVGRADAGVNFLARGQGYDLSLTAGEAQLKLRTGESSVALTMKLAGANRRAQASGLDQLPGKANYFLGADPRRWKANITTYRKVKYEAVYPGIDLVYYGAGRQLEYDFIISPGAEPHRIAINFAGAERMRLDERGNLILQTKAGEFRQQSPEIYQEVNSERRRVAGRYSIRGNTVGFEVEPYDTTRPLVIDPVLVYSGFLVGGAGNVAYESFALDDIAIGGDGAIYVAGTATTPGFAPLQNDNENVYLNFMVMKLNPAATAVLYTAYFGGDSRETEPALTVDAAGQVYVAGVTTSSDYPTVNAYQSDRRSSNPDYPANGALTKLSADGGAILYSTYLSDGETTRAHRVAVRGGTAYVGMTFSQLGGFIPGWGLFGIDTVKAGAASLVSRHVFSNMTMWVMTMDENGYLYIGGEAKTSVGATPGAVDAEPSTSRKHITKLDPTKTGNAAVVYRAILNIFQLNDLAVDPSGTIYAAGSAFDNSVVHPFTPTANAAQPNYGGGYQDACLAKLSADGGALLYATFLGGEEDDRATSVAVNSAGQAYLIGFTRSPDFPVTPDAFQSSLQGTPIDFPDAPPLPPRNSFVVKIDTAKSGAESRPYSSYFGSDSGYASSAALDGAGDLYFVGAAGSDAHPVTQNALASIFPAPARRAGVLVKFSNDPGATPAPTAPPGSTPSPTPTPPPTPTPTPEPPGFTIRGYVRDRNGNGIPGVRITLSSGGEVITIAQSAPSGYYITGAWGGADYKVEVPQTGWREGSKTWYPNPGYALLTNLSSAQEINFAYNLRAPWIPPSATPTPSPTPTPTSTPRTMPTPRPSIRRQSNSQMK
ncbi:MAG: hypothetical protein ACREAB_09275 [Blastocatellia bacterium]